MIVHEEAEEAVENWLEYAAEAGYFDKHAIVESATEGAVRRLDNDEWTGDENQWDEVRGIVERVYDRKVDDYR